MVSVFERLSNKADTPSKDNESSDKNQEGGSSKGSRSPPSVVERLGFPPANSSEKKIKAAEQSTTKRKRSSTSGGRDNKKARLNGREDTISPPSVFHRLGSQVVVPEENQSGDKKHSAHIAANTQSHSVQRITSPKIRHFLWKCISDSLPAAANMRHRHIAKDGNCGRCNMDSETVNHILFTCPYARLIWAVSPIQAPPNGVMSDTLYANIYRVLNIKHHSPDLKIHDDLVPWLLWRIWKNRNEFIFKWIDYSAPNGAWRKDHQCSGVGWIAHNDRGKMLWAGVKNLQRMGSPIETDAEGIKWAMQSLCSLGYKQVIFETDSQVLARMVTGKESIWPKLELILQEIQNHLSGNPGFKVVYYSIEGNKAADRVAKEAFSLVNYVLKLSSILPLWLKSICKADMPIVNMNSVGE
ncbi:hypothetical protein Bca101_043199 [Brassica carinata]